MSAKLLTFPFTREQLDQTPYAPDWIVTRYGFTSEAKHYGLGRVQYGYWVQGINTNRNEPFHWIIPSPFENWRYDMHQAEFVDWY